MLSTPDLSDLNPEAQALSCQFRVFGKRSNLFGAVATIACFEDNSRVKEAVAEPGDGRVLLVDGGGSLAKALTSPLSRTFPRDPRRVTPIVLAVADTGATQHMLPDHDAFLSYHRSDKRVRMASNTYASVQGEAPQ